MVFELVLHAQLLYFLIELINMRINLILMLDIDA